MLPRLSGIDVCRQLRKRSQVPIIMVTAKGAEIDTVVGLEVGADDYVTKPYRIRELVARMRAVLRRSPSATRTASRRVRRRDRGRRRRRSIPTSTRCVVAGERVTLPLKEFELLHLLLANAGRVLPRETLIDRVWGSDYVGDTKTLDVHIKRLRAQDRARPGQRRRGSSRSAASATSTSGLALTSDPRRPASRPDRSRLVRIRRRGCRRSRVEVPPAGDHARGDDGRRRGDGGRPRRLVVLRRRPERGARARCCCSSSSASPRSSSSRR